MQIQKFIRKIQRNIEDYGVICASGKVLSYLLRPLYEKKVFTIYGINLEGAEIREVNRDDVSFKLVKSEDSEIVGQIEKMEEWLLGRVKQMIAKQGFCLAAIDNEKVVGFNLVSFGEVFIPLLKLKKMLAEDEAWSEQISVRKDYRRRGIASDLRQRVFHELQERGIRKFYGGTLSSNQGSLKLARTVGFNQFDDIQFVKILKFKKWRSNGAWNEISG